MKKNKLNKISKKENKRLNALGEEYMKDPDYANQQDYGDYKNKFVETQKTADNTEKLNTPKENRESLQHNNQAQEKQESTQQENNKPNKLKTDLEEKKKEIDNLDKKIKVSKSARNVGIFGIILSIVLMIAINNPLFLIGVGLFAAGTITLISENRKTKKEKESAMKDYEELTKKDLEKDLNKNEESELSNKNQKENVINKTEIDNYIDNKAHKDSMTFEN